MRPASLELAVALLAGPWNARAMLERATDVLGERPTWLRGVVMACLRKFRHNPPLGEPSTLASYLESLPSFRRRAHVLHPLLAHPELSPIRGPWQNAPFPKLATIGDVAQWLSVELRALVWMAEPWRQRKSEETPKALYQHRWIPKRHGKHRLLEAPRPRLRAIQRRILDEILAWLPVHEAVHGFVRERSVKSLAEPHANQPAVLAMDLESFFTSISRARVFRVFRACGFPEAVSRLLAGLCTHATPRAILREIPDADERLLDPHLPQGAPTSPALANLCAFRLDVRLAALARSADVTFTRYADDLAFSGDARFGCNARRFAIQIAAIALEEGFVIQHRKTRRMLQSAPQRLAGTIVNVKPGVERRERERLEATLHNCVKHGPQN